MASFSGSKRKAISMGNGHLEERFSAVYFASDDPFDAHERFNEPVAWWQARAQANTVPPFEALQFRDLRGWHSRLSIARIVGNGRDLEARIVGEDVRILFSDALRPGVRFRTVIDVPEAAQARHVGHFLSPPHIALGGGRLLLEGGHMISLMSLDLPLPAKSGGDHHVLTLYDFELPAAFKVGL